MCPSRIPTLEEEIGVLRASLKAKLEELKREKEKEADKSNGLQTDGEIRQGTDANGLLHNPSVSVAVNGSLYLLKSQYCWDSNIPVEVAPELWEGKRFQSGSMIVKNGQVWTWIARYTSDKLRTTDNFGQHYPTLAHFVEKLGPNNLDICALGPNQQYYARWLNGSWYCKASTNFIKAIRDINDRNCKVTTVSFGFGKSYFISFEDRAGRTLRKTDLQECYPSLNKFLDNRKARKLITSVHAVTLDPHNKTDYLVVFTDGQSNILKHKLKCSSVNTYEAVETWWATSKRCQEAGPHF